jgi:large subunit ribosomal protein L4
MKFAVKKIDSKEAGSIELDDAVFGVEVKKDLLHSAVRYQLAKRRAGTQKTKTVAEVSGTGKKPFAQKGTGRARAGTLRAVQHRGGGTAHGILPRSYAHSMNKKQRQLALKMALSSKVADKKLIVLDDAKMKTHKTKEMASALDKLGVQNALIISGGEFDVNFARAVKNIPCVDLLGSDGANIYDILRRDNLILTKDAVTVLTERLSA